METAAVKGWAMVVAWCWGVVREWVKEAVMGRGWQLGKVEALG